MNITSITEQANGILILVGDDYEYFIPKARYSEEIDGSSAWIDHLLEKKWADKESLYKIASIISKHTKKSNIDWRKTFYSVERIYFIHEVLDKETAKLAKDGQEDCSGSPTDRTFRMIEVGRETHTEENTILMKKRVDKNLTKFGVVA